MWNTPFCGSILKIDKFIVLCNTQEEANELCRILADNGITWAGGESLYEVTYFGRFSTNCYFVEDGILRYGPAPIAENDYYKDFTKCTFRTVTLADIDIPDDVDDLF